MNYWHVDGQEGTYQEPYIDEETLAYTWYLVRFTLGRSGTYGHEVVGQASMTTYGIKHQQRTRVVRSAYCHKGTCREPVSTPTAKREHEVSGPNAYCPDKTCPDPYIHERTRPRP